MACLENNDPNFNYKLCFGLYLRLAFQYFGRIKQINEVVDLESVHNKIVPDLF